MMYSECIRFIIRPAIFDLRTIDKKTSKKRYVRSRAFVRFVIHLTRRSVRRGYACFRIDNRRDAYRKKISVWLLCHAGEPFDRFYFGFNIKRMGFGHANKTRAKCREDRREKLLRTVSHVE